MTLAGCGTRSEISVFSRQCCCWYQPFSSLAGLIHCPCWDWDCCSIPLVSGPCQGWCGHPRASPGLTVPPNTLLPAAAVVVPGLSTMVSSYGENPPPKATQCRRANWHLTSLLPSGSPGQKGTIMGILRSLGALGRAVGPMVAASGKCCRIALKACCDPPAAIPSCLLYSVLAAEGFRQEQDEEKPG